MFDVFPRFPVRAQHLPENFKRMKASDTDRKEAARLISQQRLHTALSRFVPKVAYPDIRVSDEVLMFREKPTANWVGPYVVRGVSSKLVTLDTGDGVFVPSIDKVKPYRHGHISEKVTTGNNIEITKNEIFQCERAQLKALLDIRRNIRAASGTAGTSTSKIVSKNDRRAYTTDCESAKKAEVDGLMSRKI